MPLKGIWRILAIAFLTMAALTFLVALRFVWIENPWPGYYHGPSPVRPSRLVTTFDTPGAEYTVEVVSPIRDIMVFEDRRIDRLIVRCNGKIIADVAPREQLMLDFMTAGLAFPQAGTGCARPFEVVFDALPDLTGSRYTGTVGRIAFAFDKGEFVIRNFEVGRSMPTRRIQAEYDYPHRYRLDVTLGNGRLQTVAFDCGEAMPPVQINEAAPSGTFGMMMSSSSEQNPPPCERESRLVLVGDRKSETRAFRFDAGRRLTASGAPSDYVDVVPYKPRTKAFWEALPRWLLPETARYESTQRDLDDFR